jgi:hypothetical protein
MIGLGQHTGLQPLRPVRGQTEPASAVTLNAECVVHG